MIYRQAQESAALKRSTARNTGATALLLCRTDRVNCSLNGCDTPLQQWGLRTVEPVLSYRVRIQGVHHANVQYRVATAVGQKRKHRDPIIQTTRGQTRHTPIASKRKQQQSNVPQWKLERTETLAHSYRDTKQRKFTF